MKVGGVNGNKGLINIYVFFFHHSSLHLTVGNLLHVPFREEKSHALKGHLFLRSLIKFTCPDEIFFLWVRYSNRAMQKNGTGRRYIGAGTKVV